MQEKLASCEWLLQNKNIIRQIQKPIMIMASDFTTIVNVNTDNPVLALFTITAYCSTAHVLKAHMPHKCALQGICKMEALPEPVYDSHTDILTCSN